MPQLGTRVFMVVASITGEEVGSSVYQYVPIWVCWLGHLKDAGY